MDRKPDAHDLIARGLQAERASALARTAERLEAALAEYAAAAAACAADPTTAAVGRRRRALAQAGERLWYYVIQREAVGLRRHDDALEHLEVPREVRAAMGPARRG